MIFFIMLSHLFFKFLFFSCCMEKNAPSINFAKSDSQNICGFSEAVLSFVNALILPDFSNEFSISKKDELIFKSFLFFQNPFFILTIVRSI